MSTRRTTTERIEAAKLEKAQMEAEIKRLMNLQKAEERKKRNHHISTRGAHIESILPDTIGLSDARFFTFLEKTVANDFGKKILTTLKAEQDKEDAANAKVEAENSGDTTADSATVTAAQGGSEPTLKSAAPKPNGGDTSTAKPVQTMAAPNGADADRTGDGGAPQGA